MFKLVIQDDEGKTTVVPLIRDEITIGRKEGNTIRLTERNVSRRHARILRNNGEVQIEDLGSYNGIRVNNSRIAERVSLRVSDQVQIGDYKLYLKAEGVEQVDDARTMPIERIEAPATEVMPAISAPTPTAPMPVQGIAATPAPQANRTPAATADTDPGGRPVATAAQVAALTQPAGYGKLVVISNNFAGKEFDLTRPQMIIGRTTENDLVIDHRSISRNHAKVTRDTDTGRYTISDLQSSNGVRVNGQDYGKVELRRGDTVDLGHVRLRFVEPGEDWLFSRDAVIADVPDTGGSKKGLWIALALLVLAGGAAVFFLFGRGGGNNNAGHTDNGSANLAVASDQGSQTENPGSNVAMVQTIDAAPVENPPPPNPGDEAGRIKVECLQNISDKKWTDATTCAERLMSYDKDKAKELKAKARQELQNQLNVGKLDDAVRDQDLSGAKKALKDIEPDSVYRKDSEKKVGDLENKIVDTLKPQFEAAKRKNDCKAIATALSQARSSYGPGVADRFTSYKCEVVATNPGGDHPGGEHPHNPGTGSGTATPPPPPASCDPEDLVRKGTEQEGIGQHGAALGQFEAAMKCKGASVGRLNQMAFMASCNMKSVPNAKKYWARLSTAQQTQLLQMCVRWNITREQLEGK